MSIRLSPCFIKLSSSFSSQQQSAKDNKLMKYLLKWNIWNLHHIENNYWSLLSFTLFVYSRSHKPRVQIANSKTLIFLDICVSTQIYIYVCFPFETIMEITIPKFCPKIRQNQNWIAPPLLYHLVLPELCIYHPEKTLSLNYFVPSLYQ